MLEVSISPDVLLCHSHVPPVIFYFLYQWEISVLWGDKIFNFLWRGFSKAAPRFAEFRNLDTKTWGTDRESEDRTTVHGSIRSVLQCWSFIHKGVAGPHQSGPLSGTGRSRAPREMNKDPLRARPAHVETSTAEAARVSAPKPTVKTRDR